MPSDQTWSWSASGKHPVAKDYIRLGRMFPLSISMAEWVDKGYSAANESSKTGRQPRFWRLWARGSVPDELVCGILRDSSDSIGRTYPFLVLGAGRMTSWEEQWDLLPAACEGVWSRIEYLCTRNPGELAVMEQEICATRPPEPNWREYRATREAGMKELSQSVSFEVIDAGLKVSRQKQEFRMVLDGEMSDHLIRVSHILERVRLNGKGVPNTVFLGGTFDAAAVVMFWRSLVVGDFIALWE